MTTLTYFNFSDSPLVMRGDDASSVAESESHSLVGGNSGSSIGGGVSLDAVEGSSLGNGEEELPGSDISVGKDDCMHGLVK